jgi:hypothetical protein
MLPLCYEERPMLTRAMLGAAMIHELVHGDLAAFQARLRSGEVHVPQEKHLLVRYVRSMCEADKRCLNLRVLALLVEEGAAFDADEVHEAIAEALKHDHTMVRALTLQCEPQLETLALLFAQAHQIDLYFEIGGPLVDGMVHAVVAHAHETNVKETSRALDVLIGRKGAPIDERDSLGNTPLHRATFPQMTFTLLSIKADPNAVNRAGRTPLHMAPTPEIAALLLDFGANPTLKDMGQRTPAQTATSVAVRDVLRAERMPVSQKEKGEAHADGLLSYFEMN